MTLNLFDELSTPGDTKKVIKVSAFIGSSERRLWKSSVLQEEVVQRIRIERIRQAQGEEVWIQNLKVYRIGDLPTLSSAEAKIKYLDFT